jgi:Protein of unknown function (DUF2975)
MKEQDSGQRNVSASGMIDILYFLLLLSITKEVVVILIYLLNTKTGFPSVTVNTLDTPVISVVVAFLYMFGSWILLKLISDIRQNRPFQMKNIQRIRFHAWGALVYLVLAFFRTSIFMIESGPSFRGKLMLGPSPALVGVLCLFALAQVFKHGLVLRQEQDLTV